MEFAEKWIWLPKNKYPDRQTTNYTAFTDQRDKTYTVSEFKREYLFEKEIASAHLRFSGDTEFWLYCNDELIATGPILMGGDFGDNDTARSNYYATELTIEPKGKRLDFFARVKMTPVRICEFSKGHGGFMLAGYVTFTDGTKKIITTDESWKVRLNGAYTRINFYDSRIEPDEYVNAEKVDNIWCAKTSPLRIRSEKRVLPISGGEIYLEPGEEKQTRVQFDMIRAGYYEISVQTDGEVHMDAHCMEFDNDSGYEGFYFKGSVERHRGTLLQSVGCIKLTMRNHSDTPSKVSVALIATHYPVDGEAVIKTSDKMLDKILDVCRHTLKYCRQRIHLDSPKHCEPLACTGDYYIEALMTAYSFGDMALVEEDVLRTAEMLRRNDGRICHTSYSLIWVLMLRDAYLYTGNRELLEKCEDALILLLDRFSTYIGENGIIEIPPDYMFVDWIYIDGITLHHPPKALGQTCLNMFYYAALDAASAVYGILGEEAMAKECVSRKESLKERVNALLFDAEKGLYFEGMNTPTPEHLINYNMPQNVDKRYYLKQSNILAVYSGVCDGEDAKKLIEKIVTDECPGGYQPYFAHYLLEGIYKNGLRDEYLLKVLEKWKAPVEKCSMGLVEGFIPPEPTYSFDYSHAWGGTPLYILPRSLLGLEINEAGLKEITLSPSLLGLESAYVEFPTPYGYVVCDMQQGKEPKITAPDEVKVNISKK